ncbi:MAG: ThiF family adenylyltransferase [Gallionella sp.]
MQHEFNYESAFSRNIGWLTCDEQTRLRTKRIAIAGMGGVGGSHLLTLTRLGIGAFKIADFDEFELPNFNRQAGANMASLGRPKVQVLAEMARQINPALDIHTFNQAINADNVNEFLNDVDLFVDGIDFFAFDARRVVYQACKTRGIPAVMSGPIGMGVGLLTFLPGSMSFEEYFHLADCTKEEQAIRFLIGLVPALLHRTYLVDPSAVDFAAQRGPSTPMACELCAGAAATEALKILLGRGKVRGAPHGFQYDAYRSKLAHTWRPWGNSNPLQQLALFFARRQFKKVQTKAPTEQLPHKPQTAMEQILDLARWAPSGDNTQVWRFEIINDHHVVVHGRFIGESCVYDLQGNASQIALGALLETLAIAASGHGLRAEAMRRGGSAPNLPTFDVHLAPEPDVAADSLISYIRTRSVQRRPLRTRALSTKEKQVLEGALPDGYRVMWLEGFGNRLSTAVLMFRNAGVRLTMPEAYEEHRKVIEWRARFSEDRIPDQALGTDPMLTRIMEWAMASWARIAFLNRYLAGTWLARIEMDLIPGLFCGAHFALVCDRAPVSADDYLGAGRAIQRFWLAATKLGLQLQPETTPLIFRKYIDQGIRFTRTDKVQHRAETFAKHLDRLLGDKNVECTVFMGRIGAGSASHARSLRRPLGSLLIQASRNDPD